MSRLMTIDSLPTESVSRCGFNEGKYLTFILQNETYGIRIHMVKEIIGMMPITSLPQMPAYIKGVINLRGKVIPVIDLRSRFKMPETSYSNRTCTIVVETRRNHSSVLMGIVVDEVAEVITVSESDIDEPSFGVKLDTEFILGMVKAENGVKILLNIDRVLMTAYMLN